MANPAQMTFRITPKIGKEKRAALGNLCIHWAILEQRVEQVIWALNGVDRKAGRPMTGHWFFKRRINEMQQLADKKFPDAASADRINRLCVGLREMATARNWAVHGLWGYGTGKGQTRRTYAVTYFKNPNGKGAEMSGRGLNNLSDHIAQMHNLLGDYITKKIGVRIP